MALNVPRQVASLLVGDEATNRALAGLGRAIQPLLDFVNTSFSVTQAGVLSSLRDIALRNVGVTGTLTVNGDTTQNGYVTINSPTLPGGGQVQIGFTLNGRPVINGGTTINGNAIINAVSNGLGVGSPDGTNIFRAGNATTNVQVFTVDANGAVNANGSFTVTGNSSFFGGVGITQSLNVGTTATAANVVSQAGFIGNVFTASYNATATAGYNAYTDQGSTLALQWRMPRAGSIVHIYYSATHNAASSLAFQAYKNGAIFPGAATPTFAGGTTQGFVFQNATKGLLPFAAGDIIKPYSYTSAATSGLVPYHRSYCQMAVEWSA